ncbi:tRNA (cytidine(34)-2'-O)-methyltransferase [Bartonella quintana]|uniref:tRNA (cytidine(34)-2'-O)-methyltransferase n=3 Tax=Bartonella quintana TaxID=803 RepID=A0A0H3M0Z5_BARQU|nr:tRNA (cytidine(34)-2'-O)-methyltransferase [Bartonella quintana]ETS11770.1 tRNA (cytidine(34)-2'-O)-methyltransferase [Bartonella quintana BQ2-D70]ETS14574.1 tRNA (cytidine(34)-2'-O)-methyltransferase [Bartonella quintana JK 73rel]ETS16261.1 tRNA (cytidine(34)-2'-O)-methyltransferase [Bartonella quintana JK 73]ETS18264.1 tRNA (cytidine(34)-2'-O)-methyltransferase [Bartonella quintana JK 7]ETS19093.1 tRNA (cytidine(34)-2'-O)-methyltransferase [Bartonella quintana JK 12]
MMLHIALFQPDIAGNTGTILRLSACFGLHVHIIEPAGFSLSDRNLKRAGMDYLEYASLNRHIDWQSFMSTMKHFNRRLLLLSTKAETCYTQIYYRENDVLLFGRESAGVPDYVHEAVDHSLKIPMQPHARSLNLAMSVAITTGEALRQIGYHEKRKT